MTDRAAVCCGVVSRLSSGGGFYLCSRCKTRRPVFDAEFIDADDVDELPTGSCEACGTDVFAGARYCEGCAYRAFAESL